VPKVLQVLAKYIGLPLAKMLVAQLISWLKSLIEQHRQSAELTKEINEAVKQLKKTKTPDEIRAALTRLNL
jgi:hypothetical protein